MWNILYHFNVKKLRLYKEKLIALKIDAINKS